MKKYARSLKDDVENKKKYEENMKFSLYEGPGT